MDVLLVYELEFIVQVQCTLRVCLRKAAAVLMQ